MWGTLIQHKYIILFLWQLIFQVSTTYRFPVYKVQTCPTSNQSWYRAGARLHCSYDNNQRLQYLCLPNENKTTLVEFCYDNIMGLFEKGHCLYLSFSGFINQVNCSMFGDGCPERHYISTDIFKYPKCLQINAAKQCYKAVPACDENERSNPVDTSDMSITLTILVIVAPVLVVFGLIIFGKICWKKKSTSYEGVLVEEMETAGDTYRDIDILQCRKSIVLKAYTKCSWKRNEVMIDAKRNRRKYRIDGYGNLFIYDLTEKDQGQYHYITHDKRKSVFLNLEIQEIKFGNCLFRQDVGGSDVKDFVEIYSTSKDHSEAEDIYKMHTLFVMKREKTTITGATSVQKTFWKIYQTSDWMILLYFAVLVSDDCIFRWSEKIKLSMIIEEMKHIFTKIDCGHLVADDNYREMCISRQKEFSYLEFSNDDKCVTFESEESKREILQALLGICKVPKLFLDYVIDKASSSFIMKYFRLPSYGARMDELFVFLPSIYISRYLEVLIRFYMEGNSQSSSEFSSIIQNDTLVRGIKNIFPAFLMEYCLHYKGKSLLALAEKYFRSAGYIPERSETCICLPEECTEKLVDCLGIDIVIHPTFQDVKVQSLVVKRYKIPREVISWNIKERERFLTVFKSESKAVFRARAMIIGCAGAGKTSLLREIQHEKNSKFRESPHSTVGLEVLDNMFIIENGTFKDALNTNDLEERESKTLSITDFAGQSAYYACHQVYLSRRALYLLVVDMSKDLATVPSTNTEDESGSLFEGWRLKDFFLFWLQTISTYCKDWIIEEESSSTSSKERTLQRIPIPVLIIATHADLVQKKKSRKYDAYYKELENCIPENQNLKRHICRERFFIVGLPPKKPWKKGIDIENIRRAIVRTLESLPHWGERIPALWERFEKFVETKKELKVIERRAVEQYFKSSEVPVNVDDILKFYHEIGLILHFPQRGLHEIVILDVQWFVDAFKHIISDPTHFDKHFVTISEEKDFLQTGLISDSVLMNIWRENKKMETHERHKKNIILYMNKLGLLAPLRERSTNHSSSRDSASILYYIPSMNKRDINVEEIKKVMSGDSTSILIFRFTTFVPHFFFFRLVVSCIGEWEILGEEKQLYKNMAFYKEKLGYHCIALAVDKSSIQVQLFTRQTTQRLQEYTTRRIRKTVENIIKEITSTFHISVKYEIGYPCRPITVTQESEKCFVSEETVLKWKTDKNKCPIHIFDEEHGILSKSNILRFWV